jgi:uncharacterized protein
VRIVNRRTGNVLAREVERATSFWGRLRGLLGRPALREGKALAIEPCRAIHTWFMPYTIDAVFLDRELRVVGAVQSLGAFRSARARRGAVQVVELPEGTILRTGTREGDELTFDV